MDCLDAALWAFSRSEPFREGAPLAVNLGDDADTTGAVCGQQGIPEEWRGHLAHRETIENVAENLLRVSGG